MIENLKIKSKKENKALGTIDASHVIKEILYIKRF